MDKVALVTGGAHGIGLACAVHLARQGWRIVIADRDAPPDGIKARHAAIDVAGEAQVAALAESIALQEGRLDALISNAGFMIRKPIAQLTLDDWNSVIGTNLTATFLLVLSLIHI